MSQPEPMSEPTNTANRAAKITVFLVLFIDLLGFGIVLPLLPRYTDKYLTDLDPALKGAIIGSSLSVFSLMQFLFAPLWGRVSDRVGRRPILLIGLVGSVIFYLMFALASELDPARYGALALTLIFLSRIGAGICGATISTAQAVIADCTPKEQRSAGMALIGAAFGIGFTFGPLLAAGAVALVPDEPGVPGYLATGICLLALIYAWRKMPETRRFNEESGHRKGWIDFKGLLSTLSTPTVGILVLSYFLATFGFANFEGTLALLSKEAFALDENKNYLIFAYVGFVLMFAQGYLYRKMIRTKHEVTLMRLGITGMFLGMANLAFISLLADDPERPSFLFAWFLLSLAVAVTGFAFLNPSLNGLISKRSDPNRQGEVLGINQSFSAMARILGPVVGMSVFYVEDTHVLPYVVASAALCVVLFLLPKIRRGE